MLRQDLVVRAYYDGGIVETVTAYTLSGTLEVGTSTITASYKGFSDSFDVTVETSITYLFNWDLKTSLTDSVQGRVAMLLKTASQDTDGVHINATGDALYLGEVDTTIIGKTIEVDIAYYNYGGAVNDSHVIINSNAYNNSNRRLTGGLAFQKSSGKYCPLGWSSTTDVTPSNIRFGNAYSNSLGRNDINGKTIKLIYVNDNTQSLYIDDEFVGNSTGTYFNNYGGNHTTNYIYIGGFNGTGYIGQANGYGANMTITGVRIYETPTGGN